jgi:AFG3 family protein
MRVQNLGLRRFSSNGGPPKGFESWWKEAGRNMQKKAEKGGASEGKPAGEGGTPRQPSVGQLIALGGLLALLFSRGNEDSRLPIVTFQEMLNNFLLRGQVERLVVVNKQYCRVHIRPDAPSPQAAQVYIIQLGSPDQFEGKVESVQKELGIPVQEYIPIQYVSETSMAEDLLAAVPTLVAIASLAILVRFMNAASGSMGGMGGGGGGGRNIFQVGKAFPAGKKDMKSDVKFSDVAGLHQAKLEVTEFVDFLKSPQKFEGVGARLPKGGLLVGPPGTGKTLLAKAVAGEAQVPFYSMSGSDFIEMFVGVGPSRVRDLFEQARKSAPSIIFIDEIDAVGRKRGAGGFSGGGNDERENTLNQMLVEMDGFKATTGVVVLAGTNRADILDPALIRPGRFDRQIHVEKPDVADREEIFKVHLRPVKVDPNESIDVVSRRMAALTPGMSGAEIANICNEAAIYAARRDSKHANLLDFETAVERVIGGLKKQNNLMSDHDRKVIAIHEAGHAVAGWFLEHTDPLLKVSIVPRSSGALGYAQYMPEDIPLYSREALVDRMRITLAGRAAEDLFIGRITTGAADDLNKVTNIAHQMVVVQGMNEAVGLLSYPPKQNGDPEFIRPHSEETARIMDQEKKRLVDDQYSFVKQLLLEHQEKLKTLADRLLLKEVLVTEDLVDVLGERPFGLKDQYKKFVDVRRTLDAQRKAEAEAAEADAAEKAASAAETVTEVEVETASDEKVTAKA